MTIIGPQKPGGQQPWFGVIVFAVLVAGILTGLIARETRWRGWFDQPGASLQRAEEALKHGENQVAFSLFATLANKDNATAEYWLGNMAELGLGCPRNPAKAIELYKKAANQNVIMASLRLGEIYLRGDLALPDFGQAKSYLQSAAYQGNARAAMLLAQMYSSGLGMAADPRQAYAWSEVATLEGSEFAKQERDTALHSLNPGDQQAALTTARDILQTIKRRTATSPDILHAT